jgi:DNA (cytosine-5)-methyltransferase 1
MAHKPLNTFHLFSGAGGGILADLLLGHNPIGACEIEQYPRNVLLARQRDGHLPSFPIWDDVSTLDGKPWRGTVDILCGGFPCQDISAAGKGAGITGARSGLWKEYARLIDEMRPRFVFAENSPLLRTRGLGVVLEDLAALGYNARWGVLGARDVGAPHKRDRMWILAYTMHEGLQRGEYARSLDAQGRDKPHGSTTERSGLFWHTDPAEVGHASLLYAQGCTNGSWQGESGRAGERGAQDEENGTTEPVVGRVAHGLANRVDRLKALGNGQVPSCAAVAFNILSEGLI